MTPACAVRPGKKPGGQTRPVLAILHPVPARRRTKPVGALRTPPIGPAAAAAVIGDEARAIEVGSRINAGGMWINDFDTMGGVGAKAEKTAFGCSGLGGTRYGYGGFLRFLRKKAIVIRSVAA